MMYNSQTKTYTPLFITYYYYLWRSVTDTERAILDMFTQANGTL